ncbi:MAG: Ig-like domain-containing protein [Saccharofermentanales bacterium]
MLKKSLGILLVFGILIIALSSSLTTIAAATPVFEVIQTYDGNVPAGTYKSGNDPLVLQRDGPDSTMSLLDESLALYGAGSLKIVNNHTAASNWEVVRVFDDAPVPTIAAPKGFFFRLETTLPKGMCFYPIARKNMWATGWGSNTTWINYDGTVYNNTNFVPVDNFNGYVFAQLGALTPAEFELAGFFIGTWGSAAGTFRGPGSVSLVDNVGYYSVSAPTAVAEYKAIFDALNTSIPRNPSVLNNISTGNYNDELLVDTKTTMVKNITRPGPGDTFAWSIDNTAVATIDAAGVITPKKYGQATVTATLTLADASKQIKTTLITIVKGSIYFTIEQYLGVNNAVVTMDSIFGIKPKINAKVTYNGFDNMVAWKVISGDASVENLSEEIPNASALDLHSAYITFKNSGKIVVRCSLVDAPTVYRDITFTVKSNPVTLESKISEAEGLGGEFTEAGYARLTKAIADANALLAKTGVEQATYNKMIDTLQFAMDNVFVEGTASQPANSGTDTESEGGNPQTSDNGAPIGYAVILSLLFAGVALSRKLIMNRQGR